ncbi:tRNA threonylcarbamoyladenosine biosynthesis protein TsaE [Rathayibacter oskolensis]|uniref:tRNA threonylcarbamoyladenosine biosynthesis protein TsaE n=2 Tax=Rathayibacter oskolensis TaxID=1891671 RepID=A0A1X7N1I5_9MICO|nr:tRNA (adenosine(37)-N6)-threonylcarbamoyltransferase complex ATPase subunit type 1 TsaE [Rathayibacter oskolensis]SMH31148.1 tRNA threonylcarbamoyladenosine biosynthesis protein TsaE [Rathayibacter oskolensis]
MPERAWFADRTVEVEDPESMEELGRSLGRVLRAGDLLVLTGPLGAGKTTFTRGLGEGLGVRGPVTSPTFVIARTHPPLHDGPPLVHVDAYRVGSPVELDDLDLDLEHSVVVVEWGAGMLDGVSASWLDVVIDRPTAASDAAEGEEPIEPRAVSFRGTRWG